jgi:hypothetical protein
MVASSDSNGDLKPGGLDPNTNKGVDDAKPKGWREAKFKELPNYALIYLQHLTSEYHALLKGENDAFERGLLEEILKKDRRTITWNDLYCFELLLVRLLPIEKLPRKVWALRARYREVAGLREYEAYLASKPPTVDFLDPNAFGQLETQLRADIDFLLSEIHFRYAMEPIRQLERTKLATDVALATVVGIIVILGFGFYLFLVDAGFLNKESDFPGATIVVCMFSGAMGGLISMQQRFQSLSNEGDQIHNVTQLVYGKLGIWVSAITGAISAVVLLLIFAAGLLQGDLFPQMREISNPDPILGSVKEPFSFLDFFRQAGPGSINNFAKLVVWSFIAGFAERFVPDTLSRFVSRKQLEKQAQA